MLKRLKFFNLFKLNKLRPYIYLLFISCLLLIGCKIKKFEALTPNLEGEIPPDHLFSSQIDDHNLSSNLFFQSLGLNDKLMELIEIGLNENPGWLARMKSVELAKAKAGYFFDESKPQLTTSLGLNSGKENTRESKFRTQQTPRWHSRSNFSWEFDLWGKWASHKKEAEQYIEAEFHTQNGAQLTLIYEIANLWYRYLYLNEDLTLIKNQIKNHHESHILHLYNYHAGLDDNQSLIVMENEIKLLALDYNQKKRELSICQTQLSSLLGDPLDFNASNTTLFSEEPIPMPPNILPTMALKNRPDILAAQSKLIAHTHHTKATKLNLYPSINLNLSSVAMTSDLSRPFEQWKISGGPTFDIPIWSPQRKTQLAVDKKNLEIMELEWKETILNAIKEVELSLITHKSFSEDLKISQNLEDEYFKLVKLTNYKFEAGLLSKIDLLKKINTAVQAKRKANAAKLNCFFSFLNLAMSLGVNWA